MDVRERSTSRRIRRARSLHAPRRRARSSQIDYDGDFDGDDGDDDNIVGDPPTKRSRGDATTTTTTTTTSTNTNANTNTKMTMIKKSKNVSSDVDVPPSNVILRMTVQLASHVATLLLSPDEGGSNLARRRSRGTMNGDNRHDDDGDHDEYDVETTTGAMRSVMRAMDVVESKLRSLLDSDDIVIGAVMPADGMMRDWSDHLRGGDMIRPLSNDSSHDANDSSSIDAMEVWGPSRHAFLGDVKSMTGLLLVGGVGGGGAKVLSTEGSTTAITATTSPTGGGRGGTGIDPDEWHDRVQCVVSSIVSGRGGGPLRELDLSHAWVGEKSKCRLCFGDPFSRDSWDTLAASVGC